ncbi:hypothetical protein CYMTET_15442 [Cymbomonas tetramitiformis]|uniref:Uncharacterized protein n=1 Tax=Cymbomonas tetramitiformis TaxID=36881 RepID=A0AAE0CEJ6_9CHLO|nr:hypothetical protein CYMTET_38035 [Cymbomonas tetramitiformis]KAK3274476.1 hypothetical protein CYMTET_17342 [Cymbomonas tetramitiformis]KAK3276484.1 hypothetical protein CYMTET_15442 [Cymbomonas tetramitiformis]
MEATIAQVLTVSDTDETIPQNLSKELPATIFSSPPSTSQFTSKDTVDVSPSAATSCSKISAANPPLSSQQPTQENTTPTSFPAATNLPIPIVAASNPTISANPDAPEISIDVEPATQPNVQCTTPVDASTILQPELPGKTISPEPTETLLRDTESPAVQKTTIQKTAIQSEWQDVAGEHETPDEQPGVDVARSDANRKQKVGKAKPESTKAINWNLEGGAGGAQRLILKKTEFFNSIKDFEVEHSKWPNQKQMLEIVKQHNVTACYSTVIDQIRQAAMKAVDRKKKLNSLNASIDLMDNTNPKYQTAVAEKGKAEKELEKYRDLDAAALSVQEAKSGKAAATSDVVREAAKAAKVQQNALRDKINNDMLTEQKKVLDKSKRLLAEKEAQAKAAVAMQESQANALRAITNNLPSQEQRKAEAEERKSDKKRARQDASFSQLMVKMISLCALHS